jgi:hypothetical protein
VLQKMFTIFEEENKPMSEREKVHELLTKVQNASLSVPVAHFRYQLNTSGISFTVAANHLNSNISQTPDYQMARKIGATYMGGRINGQAGRGGGRDSRTEHKEMDAADYRNKVTQYYSPAEWDKLSEDEKEKIRKERMKKQEQGGSKRIVAKMTTKQLTTNIISSINKAKVNIDSDDDSPKKNNSQAGNSFGGKESAKRSKGN